MPKGSGSGGGRSVTGSGVNSQGNSYTTYSTGGYTCECHCSWQPQRQVSNCGAPFSPCLGRDATGTLISARWHTAAGATVVAPSPWDEAFTPLIISCCAPLTCPPPSQTPIPTPAALLPPTTTLPRAARPDFTLKTAARAAAATAFTKIPLALARTSK